MKATTAMGKERRYKLWQVAVRLAVVQFALFNTMSGAEDTANFYRHKLLRVHPANEEQLQALQYLHDHPPADLEGLDFWSEPSSFSETVYLRVNPQQAKHVESILRSASVPYDVIVDDLQRLIDEHSKKNAEARTKAELSVYDSYLTYDEMLSWLEDAVTLCGSRCSVIDIGRSYQGRRLVVVKITGPRRYDKHKKRGVWIDGGIHAREWISHATALYFIDRLIVDYSFDNAIRSMLDEFDFYIMPCVNPDGYHYSHTTNRLWRKTRSVVEGSKCRGADANRNFDFHWGLSSASRDPCSDIYIGPKPFSEPETEAMSKFILERNSTWKVYLSLHAYGQLWMAPYGYTQNKPRNYKALMTVGNAAKAAVENVYQTEYTVGSASNILYRSAGTSRDWAAGVPKIPYVYTVELRDQGSYGFLLPPDQILATGVETWEGVKAMLDAVQKLDAYGLQLDSYRD